MFVSFIVILFILIIQIAFATILWISVGFTPVYWSSIYFANCFVTAWKRFFRKFSENRKAVYSV